MNITQEKYYTKDNTSVLTAAEMRAKLNQYNFYTSEALQTICEKLKNTEGIGSYISSFNIYTDKMNPSVKLNFRKTFFKRFEETNNLDLYRYISPAVQHLYYTNGYHLSGIVDINELHAKTDMMYDICKVGETSIILTF